MKRFGLRSEKGISMVTLVTTIVIMLIIATIVIYNSRTSMNLEKLDKMYADIQTLQDKVDLYYANTHELPISSNPSDKIEINRENDDKIFGIDPAKNDGNTYSKIDLSKISINPDKLNYKTDYYVNEDSHIVYSADGVNVDGVAYHRAKDTYSSVTTIDDEIDDDDNESKKVFFITFHYPNQDNTKNCDYKIMFEVDEIVDLFNTGSTCYGVPTNFIHSPFAGGDATYFDSSFCDGWYFEAGGDKVTSLRMNQNYDLYAKYLDKTNPSFPEDDDWPGNLSLCEARYGNESGDFYYGEWTNSDIWLKVSGYDNTRIEKFELYDNSNNKKTIEGGIQYYEDDPRYASGSTTYNSDMNSILKLKVYDISDNSNEKKLPITFMIDKTNPSISSVNTTGVTLSNLTLNIVAKDNLKDGIQDTNTVSMLSEFKITTENNVNSGGEWQKINGNLYDGKDTTDSITINISNSSLVAANKISNNGDYYIWVKDQAGNISNASENNKIHIATLDETAPTVTFEPGENKTYAKTQTVVVNIHDEGSNGAASSGVKNGVAIQYGWSTDKTKEPKTWVTSTNVIENDKITITGSGLTGKHYLWVKGIQDNAGNVMSTTNSGKVGALSGQYYFDNTAPIISNLAPESGTEAKASYSVTYNIVDDSKVIYYYGWSTSAGTLPTTWSKSNNGKNNQSRTTPNSTGNYYFWIAGLVDEAGNETSSKDGASGTRETITYKEDNTNKTANVLINKVTGPYKVDKTPPTVTFIPNGTDPYQQLRTAVKVKFEDENGIDRSKKVQYIWSESANFEDVESLTWTEVQIKDDDTIDVPVVEGKNYIWVRGMTDSIGNEANRLHSNQFRIDNTAPVISVSPSSGESAKTRNVTINVTDEYSGLASDNVYEYQLSTSNETAPTGTWTRYSKGGTITIGNGLTGTYYLWVREVKDKSDNTSTTDGLKVENYHVFGSYIFDNSVPNVEFDPNGTTVYAKSQSTKVTVTDRPSGIKEGSLKYQWTQSKTAPAANTFNTTFESGDTITKSDGTGNNWYLWIYAEDNLGNNTIVKSNPFYLDNTNPVIEANDINYGDTLSIVLKDSNSGVVGWQIVSGSSDTAPTSNWTEITASSNKTVTKSGLTSGTYRIWAKDLVGNTSFLQISVGKKGVKVPTKKSTLTYNTKEQTQDFNDFDTNLMTLSGTQKATDAGNYTAKFTLKDKNNYIWETDTTDDQNVSWTIEKYNLSNASIAAIADQTYTGNAIKPEPAVTVPIPSESTTTLTKDTHFTFGYSDNINVGTANITVTAKDNTNYTGSKSGTFKIVQKGITIPTKKSTLTYNTKEQTQDYNNYDSSVMTIGGTQKATNAGSYTATFTLKDTANYKWSDGTTTAKSVNWTIEKYNLSNSTIATIADQTYTGSAIKPEPAVTVPIPSGNTTTLTKDTHFTFGYSNNTNVGTANITVTAKDNTNYTGSKSGTFKIVQKGITIPTKKSTLTYNTEEQTQDYNNYDLSVMTIGGTQKATNAGSYTATFTLKDTANYKWSDGTTTAKSVNWTIEKYNLSNASIATISDQTYTGNAIKPEPAVTVPIPSESTTTLTKNTHFTFGYSNNTNVGTANITVTAKDNTNYTGSKSGTFKIVQKGITIPTKKSTLTYNTKEQVQDFNNYNDSVMTISGTQSATNAGSYTATFTLLDTANNKWSDGTTTAKSVNWTIEKYNLSNASIATISDQTYTGSAIKPEPAVTVPIPSGSTTTLTKNTHFTYGYSNNINVGTANITITAKDNTNYTGSKTSTFKITKKGLVIPTKKTTLTYNSGELTQDYNNYNSSLMTIGGTQKATNAGSYTATFTLKDTDNYMWEDGTTTVKSVLWTIEKYDLSNCTIAAIQNQTYTGSEIKPTTTVTVPLPNSVNPTTLTKDVHYTFGYNNNINVGTATITVTAKDNTNYKGSKSATFNIIKNELPIPTKKTTLTYNAREQTQDYNNYDSSLMTIGGVQKATDVGTYTATFTLKDTSNYKWSDGTTTAKSVNWTIEKFDLSNCTIAAIPDQTFTASEVTPKPAVTVPIPSGSSTTLTENTHFTFSYSNNVSAGTATITVTAKDNTNYKGTKSGTFNIVQNGLVVPAQSGTLTFNTMSQSPTWDTNYDSSKMTITGTQSAINAGTYTVTFKLKDSSNYRWRDGSISDKSVTWTIGQYDLSNANMTQSAMDYTGSQLKPEPTVTVNIPSSSNKTTLSKGTHFTYSYGANVNAGTNTGSVTITAVANTNYKGTKTVQFTINSKKLTVPAQSGTLTYNTSSQSPTWNSNYDSSKMTLGGDTSKVDAGTYTATFTLKDAANYTWSDGTTTAKNANWTIGQYDLSNANMTQNAMDYTGSQLKPEPAVTVNIPSSSNKTTLSKGTHFTYSYGTNINAGTNAGSVTITAVANTNYKGTKTVQFTINSKKLTVPVQSGTLTYNTGSQSPTWNSNYDSSKMTIGGDTSKVDAGSYTATFTLKDTANYTWSDGTTTTKNASWTIGQYNLSNANMTQSAMDYTGTQIKPEPVVTVNIPSSSNPTTLIKNTHFTYSYGVNINAGANAGKVTITAKDNTNYTGTKTINFTINTQKLVIPAQSGTLTYNTNSQSPTWNSSYDSVKMTLRRNNIWNKCRKL